MSTSRRFLGLSLLVAMLWTLAPSSGQAKGLDFSTYAGVYKGTLTYSNAGIVAQGVNFRVAVSVPKNGRWARIAIDGSATASAGPSTIDFAFIGNTTIFSNRTVTTDDTLLAFYLETPSSTVAAGKKVLTYTLTYNSGFTGLISVTYTLRFQGKRLLISGLGVAGGSPVTVSLVARKKGK